jgi:hypothetical protein
MMAKSHISSSSELYGYHLPVFLMVNSSCDVESDIMIVSLKRMKAQTNSPVCGLAIDRATQIFALELCLEYN